MITQFKDFYLIRVRFQTHTHTHKNTFNLKVNWRINSKEANQKKKKNDGSIYQIFPCIY